jgi:hypothetical protein
VTLLVLVVDAKVATTQPTAIEPTGPSSASKPLYECRIPDFAEVRNYTSV